MHKEKDSLKKTVRFAVAAPVAMALLLGVSFNSPATAGDWGDSGSEHGDRDHDKDHDKEG